MCHSPLRLSANRSRSLSNDQVALVFHSCDGILIHQIRLTPQLFRQKPYTAFASLYNGVFDGGQIYPGKAGGVDVVKAAEAYVFRYALSGINKGCPYTIGDHIVYSDDGGDVRGFFQAAERQGVSHIVFHPRDIQLLVG